ncbi:hypothetical protein LNP74_23535 [Klebsiella pneumoniae subsp. pneumoniae]|nr:hypothetical protein [Klebsiella pneumoniae subsp. pneumoniae]
MCRKFAPTHGSSTSTQPGGHGHRGGHRHTNFKRFIGVCNIPIGMKMFITDVLQLSPSDELNIDLLV